MSAATRNGVASVHDLGTALRDRREAMGISLAEVEAATRIRVKYLAALESDEWHLLPGEVVGRGFLRNYADFLGLEPNEIIERRRAVADPGLSAALSSTSAGAPLPPLRTVDYRPKEVDLKDEGDGIQRVEIRWRPILAVLGLVVLLIVAAWTVTQFSAPISSAFSAASERLTEMWERREPTPTSAPVAGIVNVQNLGADGTPVIGPTPIVPIASGSGDSGAAGTLRGSILLPSPTPNPQSGNLQAGSPQAGNPPAENAQPAAALLAPTDTPQLLQPTNTPEVLQPTATNTPEPLPPTPTFTPEPPTATPEPLLPTETPTPEPPLVVAPACADPRSMIVSPGVNQVLSGVTGVTGTATHENLQYYKLEYAAGANAGGNFVYFDGSSSQINGGLLGNLDTRALPNGDYTIRLTVVDQTGNFPPPCDVSVVIQN